MINPVSNSHVFALSLAAFNFQHYQRAIPMQLLSSRATQHALAGPHAHGDTTNDRG